jgi:hypothetical protein
MDGELQTVDLICSRCGVSFTHEPATAPAGLTPQMAATLERMLTTARRFAVCPGCAQKHHRPANVKPARVVPPAKQPISGRLPYKDTD